MYRNARHLLLAATSATAFALAATTGPAGTGAARVSMVAAWICLILLAWALLIGPRHALRTGRPLLNHLPRRDLGIWAALAGLVHLAIAFRVSMNNAYLQAFVDVAAQWPGPAARRQMYLWAVVGSLVIAVLFVLLLALSSNRALRLLGPVAWKRIQRGSYAAFALTIGHSIVFQLLERRSWPLVLLLAALTLAVCAAQAAGWRRVRLGAR
jgi:DMSO/TMAO reductase YedYZ heme-binding membrane subunit